MDVELRSAQLELAIDLDSDPISGSVMRSDAEPRRFSGWIELVEAIEAVRASASKEKTLGWLPGAKAPRPAYLDGQDGSRT